MKYWPLVAVAFIAAALAVSIRLKPAAAEPPPQPRAAWEYKWTQGINSQDELNKYGADGWELVTVMEYQQPFRLSFIFKRPAAGHS